MSVIFLSYRRNDSRHVALNIYRWFIEHGIVREDVFFDQSPETNQYGKQFPESIQTALESTKVMLALIGPTWATEKRSGWFRKSRIMEQQDWVRREIADALERHTPILPVRIDDTAMPTARQTPPSIRALCGINSMSLRTDAPGFEQDMQVVGELIAEQIQGAYYYADGRFIDLLRSRKQYLVRVSERFHEIELPAGGVHLSLDAIFQPLKLRRDPVIVERQDESSRLALPDEALRPLRESRMSENQAVVNRPGSDGRDQGPQENVRVADEQGSIQSQVVADSGVDALGQSATRRMVVLGGPGTGKSTLLADFVATAARRALDNPEAPIPIFISLPELARTGQWTQSQLTAFLEARLVALDAPSDYATTLFHLLRSGRAFLCLDGLDEVGPLIRPQILAWIKGLPEPDKDGAIIIGSRFTEYKGGEFSERQFYEWELQPFDHGARLALAARLILLIDAAIEARHYQARDAMSVEAHTHSPEAFVSALEGHPRAAAWSENPLLFTLAAYLYCEHGVLPEQRVDLYGEIIDAIVRNPARVTEINESDIKTTRDIVAGVALELFARKGRTFSADELTDALRPLCVAFGVTDQRIAAKYDRIVASGLLDVVAHHVFGFRHLTFQEYLAAVALAWRLTEPTGMWRQSNAAQPLSDTWSFIRKKRGMARWTEILRLMTGVLMKDFGEEGRRAARVWLEELALLHTTQEGDPGYLSLTLAAETLVELPWEHATVVSQEHQLGRMIVGAWAQALKLMAMTDRQAHINRLLGVAGYLSALPEVILGPSLANLARWTSQGYPLTLRVSALRALGHFRTLAPIDLYVDLMNDTEYLIRDTVSDNFGLLGPEAPLDRLISGLNDQRRNVRECAAWSLGKVGNLAAIEPLMRVVGEVGDRRGAALWALDRMREGVPLEFFVERLSDQDDWVRLEAVRALKDRETEVKASSFVPLISTTLSRVREEVALALGIRAADAPVEPLIQLLCDTEIQVRVNAIWALGQMPDRAPIDELLGLLSDPDERVRRAAQQAIQNIGPRVPIEALAQVMRDSYLSPSTDLDMGVEEATLGIWRTMFAVLPGSVEERLRRFRDVFWPLLAKRDEASSRFVEEIQRLVGQAVPVSVIVEYSYDLEQRQLQTAAIQTLANLGALPFETLQPFLSVDDIALRTVAVLSLGVYEPDAALDLLYGYLGDEAAEVRAAAAVALGMISDPASLGALLSALRDRNAKVREEAAYALSGLEVEIPAVPLLAAAAHGGASGTDGAEAGAEAGPVDARVAAMWALGNSHVVAPVEILAEFMTDPSAKVRVEALKTCERRGTSLPPPALVTALHDENQEVRDRARKMLLSCGDAAIPALVTGMKGKPLREDLPELGILKEMETLLNDQLVALMRGPDSLQRKVALWVCWMCGVEVPMSDLLETVGDPDEGVQRYSVYLLENHIPGIATVVSGRRSGSPISDRWLSQDAMSIAQERLRMHLRIHMQSGRASWISSTHLQSLFDSAGSVNDRVLLVLLLRSGIAQTSADGAVLDGDTGGFAATDGEFRLESADTVASQAGWWWRAVNLLRHGGREGSENLAALAEGLTDAEPHVRAVAAWLATRAHRLELIERALADHAVIVRATALLAMDGTTPAAARTRILSALQDPALSVRYFAAQRINEAAGAVSQEALGETLAQCASLRFEPLHEINSVGIDLTLTNDDGDPPEANWVAMLVETLAKAEERIPSSLLDPFFDSPYNAVRKAAVTALASGAIQAPVSVISARLEALPGYVQREALRALGQLADQSQSETLLAFTTSEDAEVRRIVIEALGRYGNRVPADVFLRALSDESDEVIHAAFDALKDRQERIPTDVLMRMIEASRDRSLDWRRVFIQMARDDSEAALAKVPELLKNTDISAWLGEICKDNAVFATGARSVLLKAIEHESGQDQQRALTALLTIVESSDSDVIAALQGYVADIDANRELARQVLQKLRELHTPIAPSILEQAIESSDVETRREALRCYAAQFDEVPHSTLAQTMRDSSALVRYDTLQLIRELQDAAPLDLVIDALADQEKVEFFKDNRQVNTRILDVAIEILQDRGLAAFPVLIRALGHADDGIRWLAIQILDIGSHKHGGSIPEQALICALGDSYERVSERTLRVLSRMKPENAEEEHQTEELAETMLAVLRGDAHASFGSIIAAPLRTTVASLLNYTWHSYVFETVIEYLRQCLDDVFWSVRQSAAIALGTIQRRVPEETILRLYELRHDPESVAVQVAADDALVKILSVDVVEGE